MKAKWFAIFFVLLFFVVNRINAQSYVPMLSDSLTWYITESFESCFTIRYRIYKDTFISANQYKIVHRDTLAYTFPSADIGYIREDTLSKKVFYYQPQATATDTAEFVLYDFSLIAGDSIFVFTPHLTLDWSYLDSLGWFRVDSVSIKTILIGDRKCIHLHKIIPTSETSLNYMDWVEGIGAVGICPWYSQGAAGWLQCSWRDTTHEFSDLGWWPPMPDTACICAMGIHGIELLSSIKISPNPATDWLSISLKQETNSLRSVALLNYLGQQIIIQSCEGTETGIDVHDFPTGIYTVIISTKNGRVAKAFIKQ